MDDPVLNCVLSICCPPLRAEEALAKAIAKYCGESPTPEKVAAFLYEYFDLAEKGTLQPFKDSVARLARGDGPKDAA